MKLGIAFGITAAPKDRREPSQEEKEMAELSPMTQAYLNALEEPGEKEVLSPPKKSSRRIKRGRK